MTLANLFSHLVYAVSAFLVVHDDRWFSQCVLHIEIRCGNNIELHLRLVTVGI
jgi:hypothetical protein